MRSLHLSRIFLLFFIFLTLATLLFSCGKKDDDPNETSPTPSGVLDTTFGQNGVVIHNSAAGGNSDDKASAIIPDSSGNIFVTG